MVRTNRLFRILAILTNLFWIILLLGAILIKLFNFLSLVAIVQIVVLFAVFISLNAIIHCVFQLIYALFVKYHIGTTSAILFGFGVMSWLIINLYDPGGFYNWIMMQ